jgi:ABC-type dipeptide/oligopeptide/nickel transport system ATPase component
VDIPAGCRFHPRCPIGDDACCAVDPQLAPAAGHRAACIKL